ncbi:MAG: hypothetical protein QOJ73_4721 [Streptosporangiaceae bacterium]|jgi:hypothetical protein|nr:hypothetical protein [Streptosporangiaceae bacterium]
MGGLKRLTHRPPLRPYLNRRRKTPGAGAHPYRDDELQAVATQGVATFMSRYGGECDQSSPSQ